MKRVPTVKPYTRRTMRALAIVQGLLILVSLMVPITAMAAITAVVSGPQSPDPVTAGGTATYTVTVTNGLGDPTRGISVTSISGLPSGASLLSSTCVILTGGGTGTVDVVVATTVATPAGSSTITMTAQRWTPGNGVCGGGSGATATGSTTLVVAAAPIVGTTTAITSDLPDPSTVNTPYTVDVSVIRDSGTNTITGTVTVSDGTDSCTDTTPTDGTAATVTYSCNLTSTTTGAKTLTASYPGNVVFSASSGTAGHTVKTAQTITFPVLTGVRLDQSAPTTAATASSGLPVSYSTASTACSVTSGGVITLLATGTCSIDADQAGDGTYMAAPQVTRNFSVAKGNQTISFGALADQSIAASPITVAATASSGLPVTFASNSLPVCTVSGTIVSLLTTGTCSITASQAGDVDWDAAVPTVTRTFQVTAAPSTTVVTCPASVEYDGSAQTPCTVSVTGAGGLNLTPSAIYTLNTDVGTATASYTYPGDANHAGSSGSATFDITAAPSTTVVTCPASVEYDGSAQTPCTVSVMGAGGLNLTPSAIYTLNTDVGTATASYTYPGDANHAGSSGSATFDITAAPSTTVVTCPASVEYDGSAQTPCTVSVMGAGGLNLTPSAIYTLNTDVGTATASYTYPGDANHAGSSGSATFDITAAPSTTVVTFEPGSKAFRGSPFTATAVVQGAGGLNQAVSVVMSGNCEDVTVPNGCTATASFPGNGNHDGSSDTQSITITPASQAITFASIDPTTTDTTEVELDASADSNLPVTFASLTPAVCTVSGSTATILTTGTCTIEADQAGDVNHDAAAPVTQSFVIAAGADPGEGPDSGSDPDSGTGAGTDEAPAPPDTSQSGSSPFTAAAAGSIPWILLIGAMTAVALGVVFLLMTMTVIKRQRDGEQPDRTE